MDRVGGNKERMVNVENLTPFPHSLYISSFFLHFLADRHQGFSRLRNPVWVWVWDQVEYVQDADDVDAADDDHDADDVDAAGDVDAADDSKSELGITDGCQNQVVRPPSCC